MRRADFCQRAPFYPVIVMRAWVWFDATSKKMTEGAAQDEWIIRENIRRFRELLKSEPDEEKKRVLENLLAAEEAKLTPGDQQN
jgi:hypothetical protein